MQPDYVIYIIFVNILMRRTFILTRQVYCHPPRVRLWVVPYYLPDCTVETWSKHESHPDESTSHKRNRHTFIPGPVIAAKVIWSNCRFLIRDQGASCFLYIHGKQVQWYRITVTKSKVDIMMTVDPEMYDSGSGTWYSRLPVAVRGVRLRMPVLPLAKGLVQMVHLFRGMVEWEMQK